MKEIRKMKEVRKEQRWAEQIGANSFDADVFAGRALANSRIGNIDVRVSQENRAQCIRI